MPHDQPVTPAGSSPPKDRGLVYPVLDAMRFIAAFMVMLNHLRGRQFLPFSDVDCQSDVAKQVFFCLTRLGNEAVVLFFVLSGFLVGGASIERHMRSQFNPTKYFIDRATRIYVPLIPIVLLSVLGCHLVGLHSTTAEILVNLASVQGAFGPILRFNASLWSLTYEVWFYILAGGILALLCSPAPYRWLWYFAVFASALIFSRLEIGYLFAWLLGAAAYFLRHQRVAALCAAGFPLVMAGGVAMQVTGVSREVNLADFAWIDRSVGIITLACGSALAVAAAAQVRWETGWRKVFADVTGWCARSSYTLYLVHVPLLLILSQLGFIVPFRELTIWTMCLFVASGAIVVGVGWLVYLPFEKQTPVVRNWCYGRLLPR